MEPLTTVEELKAALKGNSTDEDADDENSADNSTDTTSQGTGSATAPNAGAGVVQSAAQGEPIGFIMRKLRSKLPGSEATYAIPDSHSWIEPYFPRDHAYTWPQY
jgi:hypothetical protein